MVLTMPRRDVVEAKKSREGVILAKVACEARMTDFAVKMTREFGLTDKDECELLQKKPYFDL